jgi:hypothetical protein
LVQVLAFMQWGSAGAAIGVMIDDRYTQSCVGSHKALCRRLTICTGLALLTGLLGAADFVVLLVARFKSNGPHFVAMVMAMIQRML